LIEEGRDRTEDDSKLFLEIWSVVSFVKFPSSGSDSSLHSETFNVFKFSISETSFGNTTILFPEISSDLSFNLILFWLIFVQADDFDDRFYQERINKDDKREKKLTRSDKLRIPVFSAIPSLSEICF
jgi:hypothetical protein